MCSRSIIVAAELVIRYQTKEGFLPKIAYLKILLADSLEKNSYFSTSGALARFHAKKSARHQEILDDLNAQISAISDQTEIEVGGLLIKYSELVKNFQKDLMKRRTKVASVDFLR